MHVATLEREAVSCLEMCNQCGARTTSICSVLPHPELRQLADCATVKTYAPGDLLIREGDTFDHVFNITEGMVMLFKLLGDGRRQVLGFLFKGDFLGLTGGVDYQFGVQALTSVQSCRFPRVPFRRLLLETPRLEEELLSRASDELMSAREHLTLLGRKTAVERVSSFLLYIADREAKVGGAPDLAFLPMTRADMGDFLGLTTETVSRVISSLKRQQVIQLLEHGGVRFLRRADLETSAEAA
ncbi:Crp/Fnr family transcriptional regulator [Caulobacter sp. S45]|uniref:Crp/Fnr family transcriptional regulator n=1 Tax=Caulobacter sp. S45 TaxID=1641861 RepID=UPI00131A7D6E|nr:Crp/Fnr family transcriptional regulator [Caulobacter sp. S45]